MMNNNYSEEIWLLVTRTLTGEATPKEEHELKEWLKEDPKHEEFFNDIKNLWNEEPEQTSRTFLFNLDNGLNKLHEKIEANPVGSNKFEISPRIQRTSYLKYSWAIAATLLLAITLSLFVSMYMWQQPDTLKNYSTTDVEQRIITLQDGSVVRLNRNSEIQVGINNDSSTREVHLKGEAFFDVAKDPDRPFMIQTGKAVIQVLGTSFNVKEGGEVMVAVREGIVSLRNRNHSEKSSATLTAGQLGLLSNDGQDVKIEETNIENYMSWMNGYLSFDSMPFLEVTQQLERIFGGEHTLDDPSLQNIQLSVYTEQLGSKGEVLETIALALDLEYYEQRGVIHWQKQERKTSE